MKRAIAMADESEGGREGGRDVTKSAGALKREKGQQMKSDTLIQRASSA